MRGLRFIKIFLCGLLCGVNLQVSAQVDIVESVTFDSSCIDVSTIQTLVHIPISDAFDILDKHGFSLGDLSDTVYDTVDFFPLRYQRSIFYGHTNGSYVLFMESLDGLSNCIVYKRSPQSVCNVREDLLDRGFVYNKERSVFVGTMPNGGHLEHYEFSTQLNELKLTCKAVDEIEHFVSRKRSEAVSKVDSCIAVAHKKYADGQFYGAVGILDSIKDFYPPMNDSIEEARQRIYAQREDQLKQTLDTLVASIKYQEALPVCDSILVINPDNEYVEHIYNLIVEYLRGNTQSFSEHSPEVYSRIYQQLEHILNQHIRTYAEEEFQRLKIHFTFHTDSVNKSKGLVRLEHKATGRRMSRFDATRESTMQSSIDSLASLSLIKPYYNQDILAVMHDELEADVTWRRYNISLNHDNVEDSNFLHSYIDTIEHRYMYERKISKSEFNSDGSSKVIWTRRLPTKCIYTFDILQKNVGKSTYLDVSLTDFETAMAFSWVPSLLIPGLGTYQQGAHSSVISRALPFFLMIGISLGGFTFQKKIIDQDNSGTYDAANGKLGNIVGWSGAGIAGIIYLSDIFEGIGNSARNTKRSKAIRKALRQGPIILESQDVPLQLQ